MKIVKYVFIIAALAAVFLTVYIATGKSEYEINVSEKTELSNQRLFRYVNNLQNFPDWNVYENNPESFKLDSIYKGTNSKIVWSNNEVSISKSIPNDTIYLKMNIDGNEYDTQMFFDEVNGKTTIGWNIKGNLSFKEKFEIFFQGTPQSLIGPIFEQSLSKINKNITESLKNFTIKNEGIVMIPEMFYMKQIVESDIENLGDKMFQSMEHMNNFAKNFELKPYGAPFTIFENINVLSGTVRYSVCMPIKNFFSTAEGSDVMCEKMPAFHGYKTVLTGDYIHSDKAWAEVKQEIAKKNLTQRADLKPISFYKTSTLNTQKSNEWVTEFIIPVNETVIPIVDTPADSLNVSN
ncbi:hypothetical protein MG290_04815 [Flavobacterium sp. CBA20B-1]|uniref:hypothetical protein n=1 Tax=unclassified Flavobacterium TaxID=196869 RepID=UPI0022243D85|nr:MULTISPECIES: hypothetical protein [unclassified Flavobacterium]WCM42997.1 hypothetical protein MG290_04815 [Flavobacterium sp. CBA20B-1]